MSTYELVFLLTTPLHSLSVFLLFRSVFSEKKEGYRAFLELVSYGIYTILIIVVFWFIRRPVGFLVLNIPSFFILSLHYKSEILQRSIRIISSYFVLLILEVLIVGSIGFFEVDIVEHMKFDSIFGIIITRVITVAVCYLMYRYRKIIKKEKSIPNYYYLIDMLILIGTLYLFITSLEKDSLTLIHIVISSMIVIVVNALVYLTEEKIYSFMRIRNEAVTLKLQTEAYENQTEIINRSLSEIRALKHDMKNHLLYIDSLYQTEGGKQARGYLRSVLQQMEGDRRQISSGNFIVDSISNLKLKEIHKTGADVRTDVAIPKELNILAYDLIVILGNLFDNAIIALEKMGKGPKLFSFAVKESKGTLMVFMDNSFDGRIREEKGRLLTLKKEQGEHGMGLNNIRRIVDKYGGEMEVSYAGDTFSVFLILPYKVPPSKEG